MRTQDGSVHCRILRMVPCDDPDKLLDKLSEKNVFLMPFDDGVRVSVAAISEAKCRKLPEIIRSAMDELD